MKYFWLQLKKLARAIPLVLIVSFLLVSVVMMVLSQFSAFYESEQESRFKVAIVGNTNSRVFHLGVAALTTLDSSRFSIDVELTDEKTAKEQLLGGEISAYVVIPEKFVKYARKGKIIPVTYYTTASTIDISGLMRDEITKVISVFLKESQKGVFGEERLLIENGYEDLADPKTDDLSFQYIDYIVGRTAMYRTKITGVSYGLDLIEHLTIGHAVVFIFVLVIPFTCMLTRKNNGLIKLLSAAGKGSSFSALSEYAALLCAYICTLILLGLAFVLAKNFLNFDIFPKSGVDLGEGALRLLPIVAMVCAFAFAIEELTGNILSNVTGFFFLSMALCYVSGCMYPLYALPSSLQKVASFTPTGAARAYIALSVTGDSSHTALITVILYILLFLAIAVQTRKHKLSRGDVAG